MRQLQSNQRAYRFRHNHSERNRHWEFEIPIQRKQNHENQDNRQRPNKIHLLLGFKELRVLTTPVHGVTLGQFYNFSDSSLSIEHRSFQIATFDAVLHADVSRIVLAVNKRRTIPLSNIRQLAQRNLLSI